MTKTPRVAVVGSGYWGKNLVRNFHDLGALVGVCDDDAAARARAEFDLAIVSVFLDAGAGRQSD